jgi:hypothetical protein
VRSRPGRADTPQRFQARQIRDPGDGKLPGHKPTRRCPVSEPEGFEVFLEGGCAVRSNRIDDDAAVPNLHPSGGTRCIRFSAQTAGGRRCLVPVVEQKQIETCLCQRPVLSLSIGAVIILQRRLADAVRNTGSVLPPRVRPPCPQTHENEKEGDRSCRSSQPGELVVPQDSHGGSAFGIDIMNPVLCATRVGAGQCRPPC